MEKGVRKPLKGVMDTPGSVLARRTRAIELMSISVLTGSGIAAVLWANHEISRFLDTALKFSQ